MGKKRRDRIGDRSDVFNPITSGQVRVKCGYCGDKVREGFNCKTETSAQNCETFDAKVKYIIGRTALNKEKFKNEQ